ncbi:flagellar hook assembly protein FlgD [Shouchella lehensis]|uniref:Flagellar hook capping protein n=1 Tax=Shouchella lehensis G1 TaxID=1246626 RepID=A0A060LXA0_9BACI|nr:flagellar hook assembly protein FlgD [Shouchella lehensis]AIC94827.1 flagellar hook capping protein [Shouchella lehensis G1]
MTQIDPSLLLSSQKQQAKSQSNPLGQEAFLKLLITQLQHQDPTNPMEDREYIAQLATFSQLEQLTQLNATMQYMYLDQKSQQLMSLSELIGKHVTWKNEDKEGSGEVTAVKYDKNGELIVEINRDEWIKAGHMLQITQATQTEKER